MQYLASCAWLQARSYSAPSLAGGVKVLTGRVVASVVSFAFLSGTFPLVLKSPVVASWRCCGQAMSQSCKTNSCLWRRWVRISDLSHEGTDLSAGEAESCPGERALGKCDHLAWLDVPLVRRLCRFGFASRRLAFEKVEANLSKQGNSNSDHSQKDALAKLEAELEPSRNSRDRKRKPPFSQGTFAGPGPSAGRRSAIRRQPQNSHRTAPRR
eukprot:m.452254 g.452254  ORF g.452254 m.452254 type:complete len:212 (+) comp56926_c0_seq8:205-840(+)